MVVAGFELKLFDCLTNAEPLRQVPSSLNLSK